MLLDNQLVEAEEVLDGGVTFARSSRRNENVWVRRSRSPSYLVKVGAPRDGGSVEQEVGTVSYEAEVLGALRRLVPRLRPHLPNVVHYEHDGEMLVVEYFENARDLRSMMATEGEVCPDASEAAARELAAVHALTDEAHAWPTGGAVRSNPPAVLGLHLPPLGLVQALSAGNVSVLGVLQKFPGVCAQLEDLRRAWRPTTAVHGDLRWDNCLYRTAPEAAGLLVDWEFARLGDPMWDVGCVFADHLAAWVRSMPTVPDVDHDRLASMAAYPLPKVSRDLRAFWTAYSACTGFGKVVNAAAYAGCRLIEYVLEELHERNDATPHAAVMLQLAANILERPGAALSNLMGIAEGEAA